MELQSSDDNRNAFNYRPYGKKAPEWSPKPNSFQLKASAYFAVLALMLCTFGFKAVAETHKNSFGIENLSQTQADSIKGTVTDSKGMPLPGVSVIVKNKPGTGTNTDLNGNFQLNVNPSDVLTFSFIGFKTQEVTVGNSSLINIALQEDVASLEQVVVVGFGKQKRANLTGSVSTIDAEALASRPVQNVGQALQGMMPGFNFQTGGLGGELNNNLSFNIRGAGTIGDGSSSSPLVLIDGMEGDMNSLNPQDIASITVLKDAAAASIYGSRAAFGVVLITTKNGQSGKPTISYTNNFKSTSPMGLPNMMDSHTFAMYWNEAAANGGEGAKFSDEVIDRIIGFQNGELDASTIPNNNGDRWQMYTGSNGNTDWFEEQYKNSAFSQDHNLSISGGTEKTSYYASAGYLDQAGLLRYSGDQFNRYNFMGKINATLSRHVKMHYSTRYAREDYSEATHQFGLFFHNIARRWPTVPVTDPNGHFTDASEIIQLLDGGRRIDQEDKLSMQTGLTITPLSNWNIYANGNFRVTNYNTHTDYLPAFAYDVSNNPFPVSVGWLSGGSSSVSEYVSKENYFNTNIYSDYVFSLNDSHNFKVMAGFNAELLKNRTLAASRTGLISPDVPTINTATDNSQADEGAYGHWATAGFFGRLNYDYKGRYLLEVNARYDGTSRFLSDQRWNLFPSVSVGWNLARENFWTMDEFMSMFKIRGSFGDLGNQNTNSWYPFFQTMPVSVNSGSWLINGQRPNVAFAPGLISSLLTWERVRTWNLGLDLAMLNDRLSLNLDYFKRNTYDMVGPAPELPAILGTSVPKINNADMVSYGFEIEALWQDRIGEFSYSVRGILSDDQQKITRYPNTTGDLGQWYNGRKTNEIWGYTTKGIAQNQEEMDAHLATVEQNFASQWGAGDIMYADINGDGKIDGGSNILGDAGDRTIIGRSQPRFRFGLDLTAAWQGFDFRMFLQGIGKRDWMPNGPYFWGANGGMWQSAGFMEHMDFYRDENSPMVQAGFAEVNKDAYFPKPYFNTGKNHQTQTRYLQNAAYMRVKNLQLGYTLPKSVVSKLGLAKIRLYLSGENLFTFTKMSDIFDPETIGLGGWNDGKTYPYSKVYSFGLNVNF